MELVKLKNINVGDVYRVTSYDPDTGNIEEYTTSICTNKNSEGADFVDVEIIQEHAESKIGFEWIYNEEENPELITLLYIGNKEINPEYFL